MSLRGSIYLKPSRSLALPLLLLAVFLGSVIFTLVKERGRVCGEAAFQFFNQAQGDLKAARDLVGLDDLESRRRLSQAEEQLRKATDLGLSRRQFDLLMQEIEEVSRTLLKINFVSSRLVYNLKDRGREVEAEDLTFDASSNLLVLDRGRGQLLRIRFEDSNPQVESLSLEVPTSPQGLDFSEDIGLIWSRGEVLVFSEKDEILGQILLNLDWGVTDVCVYAGGVYVLAEAEDQLFKISPAAEGFSDPKPWFKEPVAVEGDFRMGIDGDVYIWGSTLRRFRRGREIDFSLRGQLEGPVSPLCDLVIGQDLENIYVLGGEPSRVLRFSKDGTLLGQYIDSRWKDARALAVDRAKGKVYVLSENEIWEFEVGP